MSRTVRKLATDLDLLGCLYNFHFERFRKSIRSCLLNVRGLFMRKYTNCAITHSTARWRCGGHRRNCGRTSHSSGMYAAEERRIRAIMLLVLLQVEIPSPHSVSRWPSVSLLPHSVHVSVEDIWIRWSLVFVGIMSWITLYHVILTGSETSVSVARNSDR